MSIAVSEAASSSPAAAYGRLLPSCLNTPQTAHAIGSSVAGVREWMRRGVLKPMELDGTRAVFHRDEVAVGFVLRAAQEVFGHNATLPFRLAEGVRPWLREHLRWDASPVTDKVLRLRVVHGLLYTDVLVAPAAFDTLAQRMREAVEG